MGNKLEGAVTVQIANGEASDFINPGDIAGAAQTARENGKEDIVLVSPSMMLLAPVVKLDSESGRKVIKSGGKDN